MAEPTIKAKLVLDISSTGGKGGTDNNKSFLSGLSSALEGLDLPILGDLGALLSGVVHTLEYIGGLIKKGFNFLMQSSPLLATSIELLKKSLYLLFRPIGDILGFFVKPLAIALLRFAIPIYKKWREFLDRPETKEGLKQVNKGVGEVASGVINLDFKQVKEGLLDIFKGIKDIAGGFLGFLGANLDNFFERFVKFISDAWDGFTEIFSPIMDWLGDKVEKGLKWAWNTFFDFIGSLGGEDWKTTVDGFKKGLESVWDVFLGIISSISSTEWFNRLSNFMASLEMIFGELDFTQMVTNLKSKFEELFPGLADAIKTIFSSNDTEDEGIMSKFIKYTKEAINILLFPFTAAMDGAKKLAFEIFGSNKKDSLPTSLNTTITSFNNSITVSNNLTSSLNAIPRDITTIHTIITKRIG